MFNSRVPGEVKTVMMKKIRAVLSIIFIAFVLFCGFEIKKGYDLYKLATGEKPIETAVNELMSKEHYTSYENIPKVYFDAVVAVEDRRFYKHRGFDYIGTARAIYNDICAIEVLEGGSTISQQLAKNLYYPMNNTISRKIAEIFTAVEIERKYDKNSVLEFYVNGIYYGSGYYCIYDASMGYFGKAPNQMDFFECTLLAGIPNAPSVYSLDVNPDLAKKRAEKVITSMKECGYINENGELSE